MILHEESEREKIKLHGVLFILQTVHFFPAFLNRFRPFAVHLPSRVPNFECRDTDLSH